MPTQDKTRIVRKVLIQVSNDNHLTVKRTTLNNLFVLNNNNCKRSTHMFNKPYNCVTIKTHEAL